MIHRQTATALNKRARQISIRLSNAADTIARQIYDPTIPHEIYPIWQSDGKASETVTLQRSDVRNLLHLLYGSGSAESLKKYPRLEQ
jgi:hypothetical protein